MLGIRRLVRRYPGVVRRAIVASSAGPSGGARRLPGHPPVAVWRDFWEADPDYVRACRTAWVWVVWVTRLPAPSKMSV